MTTPRRLKWPAVCVLSLVISQSALAFRSTKVESFTDPEYRDFRPTKVVIMVRNAPNEVRSQVEHRLIDKLADYGVTALRERDLFPPTREWTPETRAIVLEQQGIDSSIIVAMGASSSSIQHIGTQTFAQTNVNATVQATSTSVSPTSVNTHGTVNGTASTSATSYNIFMARSKADFSAMLIDIKTARTAWYADLTVKAAGTAFVSDKGDAKGAVKGVVEALVDDGHLLKR